MTVTIPSDNGRPQGPRTAIGNDRFINPYNFVSTPARPKGNSDGLGNAVPAGHAAFVANTYTGTIPITITTRTPLLLPDQADAIPATENNPRSVGTRTRGRLGDASTAAPLLMGSSVKGMLRAAYEAITNSTLGVVSESHNRPGSIRMKPSEARGLRLGLIEVDPENPGAHRVRYLEYLKPRRWRDENVLPAPHVPINVGNRFGASNGIAPPDLDMCDVQAWIYFLRHEKMVNGRPRVYYFWRVSDLVLAGDVLPPEPSAPVVGGRDAIVDGIAPSRVAGRLHWTGAPFAGKHDERLMVTSVVDPADAKWGTLSVDESDRSRWDGIIESYLDAHRGETQAVRNSAYGAYARSDASAERWAWRTGRTLYVGRDEGTVYFTPAMIGRRAFAQAAAKQIRQSNRPPSNIGALSPADRVFGWAKQEAGGEDNRDRAYRGHLRIDAPVVDPALDGGSVIEHFDHPIRIGILNTPKPSQYRFYGADEHHRPKENGIERNVAEGYAKRDSRLRGRKFYLPQPEIFSGKPGASEYWNPQNGNASNAVSVADSTRYREYLGITPNLGENQFNSVSLALRSSVRPNATFRTTLFVENLSAAELGALLWLLALPDEAVMTMGLGKPLGFGAVRVTAEWEKVELFEASNLNARYRSLSTMPESCDENTLQGLVNDYDDILRDRDDLARVRKEFLNIVFGYVGVPVHYPRHRPSGQGHHRPAPQSELFKWWVANEQPGRRYWLPEIGTDVAPTLPYLDEIRTRN